MVLIIEIFVIFGFFQQYLTLEYFDTLSPTFLIQYKKSSQKTSAIFSTLALALVEILWWWCYDDGDGEGGENDSGDDCFCDGGGGEGGDRDGGDDCSCGGGGGEAS